MKISVIYTNTSICGAATEDMQQKQVKLEQRTYAEAVTVSDRKWAIKNLTDTEGDSTCDRVNHLSMVCI